MSLRNRLKTDFYRQWRGWFLAVPLLLALVLLSYLAIRPDPAALHFHRAQKLQVAGQSQAALRLYALIVSSLPDSSYAPLSLMQQGEILTSQARRSGDEMRYREALEVYEMLAEKYPSHSLAGEALIAAAEIATNDLQNTKKAAALYKHLLKKYPGSPEYASEATLRLGRIALQENDGENAQKYFSQVLKKYTRFAERSAEAQYHLGITLETLQGNQSAARSAYEATIKNWPHSRWAGNAKERLGLLFYSSSDARPARRVLLETETMPALKGDQQLDILKLLLAARGLEVGEAVIRGWSLAPFRVGYFPQSAGKTVPHREEFSTIAANVGLVYERKTETEAARAYKQLRDELDIGHAPFVRLDEWALVTGYDSAQDEIYLLYPGGKQETLEGKVLSEKWKKEKYEFLTFHAAGEKLRATTAQEKPDSNSKKSVSLELSAPTYHYKLPRLSLKNAHQRTLRRAAILMLRPRESEALLNVEALRALAEEMGELSTLPLSPVPKPEAREESGREASGNPSEESTSPSPSPSAPSGAASSSAPLAQFQAKQAKRWKELHPWFGGPRRHWIESRRDAAAYLEIAARDLKNNRLQRAAEELHTAMRALRAIETVLPSVESFNENPEATRAALEEVATQLQAAHDAEKRAALQIQSALD